MSDLEQHLRDARRSLPRPEPDATDRARAAVLDSAAEQRPASRATRRPRRILFGGLAFVAALGAAFVAGFVVAPDTATSGAQPDAPGFLPAHGWSTFQAGLTIPSAIAANFRLDTRGAISSPWDAARPLRSGDVLMSVTFYPAGEAPSADRLSFRERELPLALADARQAGRVPGQPDTVVRNRLLARVNGYDVDVDVFLNRRDTSTATRELAQAELDRLVIPKAPAVPGNRSTCGAAQLHGNVALQGGVGQSIGAITVVNVGRARCTLSGRPQITLEGAGGQQIRTTQTPAEPIWAYNNAPEPTGWPVVGVRPHGKAVIRIGVRNWCGRPGGKMLFNVRTPLGGMLHLSASVDARCDMRGAPVALTVGPFEPPS
jgi:hypothetical protein